MLPLLRKIRNVSGTRLNHINLLLHFRISQEIIMELSSVYKCDESLLILAESLFQLQVKDNIVIL